MSQQVVRYAEGEPDLLHIDLHLIHTVMTPQALDRLRLAGGQVLRPGATLATEDHNVPTMLGPVLDPVSRTQLDTLKGNCKGAEVLQDDGETTWKVLEYQPGTEVEVSLQKRNRVAGHIETNFYLDDYTAWRLLHGPDDISLTSPRQTHRGPSDRHSTELHDRGHGAGRPAHTQRRDTQL